MGFVVLGDFTISVDGLTQIPIMNSIQLPASNPAVTAVSTPSHQQILNSTFFILKCTTNCSSPIQQMNTCAAGANDSSCFCRTALQTALADCEQCMFNFLVAKNLPPVPFVGSNPVLAGMPLFTSSPLSVRREY